MRDCAGVMRGRVILWPVGLPLLHHEAFIQFFLLVNHALNITWNTAGGAYKTKFQSALARGNYPYLVMHANPDINSLNTAGEDQYVTVQVKDNAGRTASAETRPLLYPNTWTNETILQTLRIPFSTFSNQGIDVDAIKEIDLLTNVRAKGSLYFDEMQLSY